MADVFGEGDFLYKYVDNWAKLPDGIAFHECPGVAVDSQDNVYALTRGEHPIIVLDPGWQLHSQLRSWRVQQPDPRSLYQPRRLITGRRRRHPHHPEV